MNNKPNQLPKCGHKKLLLTGCKHCKKMFNEWNAKIESAGHVEIEDWNVKGVPLKSWDNLRFRGMNQEALESRRLYFEKCRELLNSMEWDNEEHKEIWCHHSEGLGVREIAKIMNKKKLKKSTIAKIIKHYRLDLA